MKVVFPIDSSSDAASGHLVRYLALAAALGHVGVDYTFISRNHDRNLNHRVTASGFALRSMAVHRSLDPEFVWRLGSTESHEADQTADILTGIEPDWLVVDHYALDAT